MKPFTMLVSSVRILSWRLFSFCYAMTDLERKRKSELPVDGEAAIEVSSEKKAKLEEKSEEGAANGGAVEGEAEVVA